MNSSVTSQPGNTADNVTGWFANRVADVGDMAVTMVAGIGDVTLFALRTVGWLFARRQRRDVLMPSFYQIGVLSLPVIALTGLFIGMVLAVQSYAQFKALGLQTRLGSVINLSLVRELGPVLAATMLAGRVGSAMAAELGTMRVTEQIDALEIMGINSASFLILPKIIAAIFFFPFLIIMSMGIGMIGAWAGGLSSDITTAEFMYGLKYDFNPFYVTYAIIKTVFFAFIISSVSAYFGYHTKGGAIAVGKSSTTAVVASSILILIFNYLLTNIMLS